MEPADATNDSDVQAAAPPMAPAAGPTIHVEGDTLRIRELSADRPSIAAYLRTIAPGKQHIALLHALEVGIAELAARRQRFKH